MTGQILHRHPYLGDRSGHCAAVLSGGLLPGWHHNAAVSDLRPPADARLWLTLSLFVAAKGSVDKWLSGVRAVCCRSELGEGDRATR